MKKNRKIDFYCENQPIWIRKNAINVYDQLPDGYVKMNSIYDIIDVYPRSYRMYELKKGNIIMQFDDKFVEYEIDWLLREKDITDKTYIKLL